jgi:hypothetical protein
MTRKLKACLSLLVVKVGIEKGRLDFHDVREGDADFDGFLLHPLLEQRVGCAEDGSKSNVIDLIWSSKHDLCLHELTRREGCTCPTSL